MREDAADKPLGPSCELETCSLLRDSHVESPTDNGRRVPCAIFFSTVLLCLGAGLALTLHQEPQRAASDRVVQRDVWDALESVAATAEGAVESVVSSASLIGLGNTILCGPPIIAAASQEMGDPREGPILPAQPDMGLVLGLYTYGAPAGTIPALKNPRTMSGCFPGTRMLTSSIAPVSFSINEARKYDPITFAGHMLDFEHVWQDTLDVQIDQLGIQFLRKCSLEEVHRPAKSSDISPVLHKTSTYEVGLDQLADALPMERLFSHLVHMTNNGDPAGVSVAAQSLGWNTVGIAESDAQEHDAASWVSDVVYLFQNPDDLTCALVFRGTDDVSDFLSDVECNRVDFCGFADPNDLNPRGEYEPRDGHVLVHRGFRDKLLRMVKSENYTAYVYPKLSSCEGVYLVGHSLGAAEASYFAACASRHLEEGDYGYNDYKSIAWQAGTAEKLDPLDLGEPGDPADGSQVCETKTSGTCHLAACSEGRGPLVQCVDGECVCQENSCNVAGYCVPKTPLFET